MESATEIIKAEIDTFELARQKAAELLGLAEKATNPGEKFFALGIAAYEMRQYAVAADHLQASFVARPAAETAIRLSMSYCRAADFKSMEKWATKAIEMDPGGSFKMVLFDTRIGYLSVFALSQFYLGRIEQAFAAASKMRIALHSDDMATDVLRLCHLARGEADLAQALETGAGSLKGEAKPGLLKLAVGKEKMPF